MQTIPKQHLAPLSLNQHRTPSTPPISDIIFTIFDRSPWVANFTRSNRSYKYLYYFCLFFTLAILYQYCNQIFRITNYPLLELKTHNTYQLYLSRYLSMCNLAILRFTIIVPVCKFYHPFSPKPTVHFKRFVCSSVALYYYNIISHGPNKNLTIACIASEFF